jgi:hypothetical protein
MIQAIFINLKKALFAFAFVMMFQSAIAQNAFYDLSSIQTIELFFSQADWDYQLDTLKAGSDGYLLADSIRVNGETIDSVGVKYKGNSSYDATYTKNPLHIALDEYTGFVWNGIKSIKLGNGFSDPSYIREVLSYQILKGYMHCPEATFAMVYINGNYIGLYSNVEAIDKTFVSNHFYGSSGSFFKCNPLLNPGPNTKSNLKYINADSTSYFNYYEMKSTTGWNDLVELCDAASNNTAILDSLIDSDRVAWMLAFDNVLVNLDSYMGVFAQNYYLYKDQTNRFNPIVWDLNMSFGGFPFIGSSNTSLASLSIANMQNLPTSVHSTDVYWPLIKWIQGNAQLKRMYIAHMKTIVNEVFASGTYLNQANAMRTLIDEAVATDTNGFFDYLTFQASLDNQVSIGNYYVPGITQLMDSRITYLQNTAEFTTAAPTISAVQATDSTPVFGSSTTMQATVENATQVWFGSRRSVTDRFVKVPMFDDGAHNDGSAGDGVYGVQVVMNTSIVQYYIYAENSNAGVFAPARAEYVYYTLYASLFSAAPGDVVFNEFVAQNTSGATDEQGQYEDWIELYNTTDHIINLGSLYLSDDFTMPDKHQIDTDIILQPHSWITFWADQDISVSDRHLNFKLLAGGEQLILMDLFGTVIDSLTYGVQIANVASARCPDGTGDFESLAPTPGYNNCPLSVDEKALSNSFELYPSPADDKAIVRLQSAWRENLNIEVYDMHGKSVMKVKANTQTLELNTEILNPGMYFVSVEGKMKKLVVVH